MRLLIVLCLLLGSCAEIVTETKTDTQTDAQTQAFEKYKQYLTEWKNVQPNERECVVRYTRTGVAPLMGPIVPIILEDSILNDITSTPITDALVIGESACEKVKDTLDTANEKYRCICEPETVKELKQSVAEFVKKQYDLNKDE